MRRLVVTGTLAAMLALAAGAAAAGPLEGLWSGQLIGSRYQVAAVDANGTLEVRAAAAFTLQNGCKIAAGDLLDRLVPQQDGTYGVTYAYYTASAGNPAGPRGDHCVATQRGPETYALRINAQGQLEWSCQGSTTSFCVAWSPVRAADTTPPTAKALPSKGRRNAVVKVLFTASDDSGQTRQTIEVLRGTKVLARGTTPLARSKDGQTYAYSFRAGVLAGKLTFCVTAVDAAGNASPRSCAPLVIS